MHNGVLLMEEGPAHLMENADPSNLVSLRRTPDVERSYHTSSTSSKPLSLNPDCYRKDARVGRHRNTNSREPWTWRKCWHIDRTNLYVTSNTTPLIGPSFTVAVWGQRQLIADKGSIDGGPVGANGLFPQKAEIFSYRSGATPNAALPERQINVDRAIKERICRNKRLVRVRDRTCMLAALFDDSYSRCFNSNLDRILKDNQGGCLYEWPIVNNFDFVEGADPSGMGDRQTEEKYRFNRATKYFLFVTINGVAGGLIT